MAGFPSIKGYSIKKKLGQGGMASVFLGVQKKLNRLVAIKVFVPNIFGDQRNARRFLKEGKTLSRLNHPNIVSVYEAGRVEDYYFIVMEYLHSSLKEKIKKRGRIPAHQALHVIIPIADALFYLHRRGLIHRDVKPENIMFRTDGTPVLLDFGIAKTIGSETHLTKTGVSIGTPHYMSPEQCAAKLVDGRSDVYSLGVVLYEMLTGRLPYRGHDTRVVVIKHLRDPVPGLPFTLNKYQPLINRMMAKEKKMRLRSQGELLEICKKMLPREVFGIEAARKIDSKNNKGSFSSTQKSISSAKSIPGQAKVKTSLTQSSRIRRRKLSQWKKSLSRWARFGLGILLAVAVFFILYMLISGRSFKEMISGLGNLLNVILVIFHN